MVASYDDDDDLHLSPIQQQMGYRRNAVCFDM